MDITLVYFVYGLAFFSMGLAMLLESGRSPLLAEASVLLPLAAFGFIHGVHEWVEMFLDKSDWLLILEPLFLSWARVAILMVSFYFLLVFGVSLLQPGMYLPRRVRRFWLLGLIGYVALVFGFGAFIWVGHADRLTHVDASLRYFLAVPAAFLAGLALQRRARLALRQGNQSLGRSFVFAALGFFVYAFTQMVAPPLDVFPGNFLNTNTFLAYAGFPVQVVRAAMAVLITVSLLNGIHAAEVERQNQFLAAQQARVDALEQVRLELLRRENMRQELLRHIVVAQEDERARISRELHDQTAQTLTAFSLHLAALRQALPQDPKTREQLNHLQNLSRQMSKSIYNLVRDLRPAQLDDLGLVAALQYLIDDLSANLNLQVKFRVLGERRRLDALVETVFFRVAQEALTNVARHAGVFAARMTLEFEAEQVTLQVADEGIGFDPVSVLDSGTAWGLAGMRERAESIGGRLMLDSAPGRGTTVKIIAPVKLAPPAPSEDRRQDMRPQEVIWKPSA